VKRRALGVALACCALATPVRAAEPDPDDPPPCRAAIEAHPEQTALAALAEEEKRLAAEARRARREARKLMRETLGAGAAARAKLPAYEALMAREADARRAGKSLCYCRKRRGDPYREDCERLYPVVIR
jgi:hypothetical protein